MSLCLALTCVNCTCPEDAGLPPSSCPAVVAGIERSLINIGVARIAASHMIDTPCMLTKGPGSPASNHIVFVGATLLSADAPAARKG
jgi:hypothetical protein